MFEEANSLFKRSLAIDEKVFGPDHPKIATTLNNWAVLLENQVRAVRFFWKFLMVPVVLLWCSTTERVC